MMILIRRAAEVRRPGTRRSALPRAVPAAVVLAAGVAHWGCATPPPGDGDTGLRIEVLEPVPLPAGSAHATFQGGRVVRGASLYEPYCDLEVRTVADTRRQLGTGRYRVSRVSNRPLLDPITRIPALGLYSGIGFDCDGIFQESILRLAADTEATDPDALHLRCIAPYYNCTFGPPLSVDQMQLVVGRYLGITVLGPR